MASFADPSDAALDGEGSRRVGGRWSSRGQRIGDLWLQERASAALRLPSAGVRGERNLLFATGHRDADRIDIAEPEAFLFDTRLMR